MLRVAAVTLALLITGSAVSLAASPPPTTTGFSDPTRIRSVKEFRLPSWGYQTLRLGFRLSGRGTTTEDDYEVESVEGHLSFQPILEIYSESEENIHDLTLQVNGEWSASGYTDSDTRYPKEIEKRNIELSADLDGEWKRYFRPHHFLTLAARAWGVHELRHVEERWLDGEKEVTDYTYNVYDVGLRMGFGFGRVRDVTHVVHALRLGERLAALGKVHRLSDGEVQGVAEHFARRSGYSRVYDRSSKYFWDDLTGIVGGIDSLTAFEAYCLSEVFAEKVGDRFEGWEVAVGPGLSSREYDGHSRNAVLSGFARGSWYRNHTLDHQTGIEAEGEIGRHIDGAADLGPEGSVRFYAEHLWVIADRLVWQPYFRATVYFWDMKETDDRDAWLRTDQTYSLASAFSFYIEDRVSINSLAAFRVERSDRETYQGHRYVRGITYWQIDLYLTYYLDRALRF